MKSYDIIVVKTGHVQDGGAYRTIGIKVGLITYLDTISMMSCNPSIGGPEKVIW